MGTMSNVPSGVDPFPRRIKRLHASGAATEGRRAVIPLGSGPRTDHAAL
jgi:hypothetical protein